MSWWICAGLAVAAVLPYLQTLRYGFINFDDGTYVAENGPVQQGLSWSNLAWAFTTMTAGNWHPLTWLSHMLDCQIFGLQPGWHHLVNGLFHGANAILVFTVVRAMTGAVWRSALVAGLFAVHPVHVESVAWIAERKDLLSTFFGLCAIWAHLNYARTPSLSRYGLVIVLFGLSVLSKPMLVTLPFVLLLLDIWPLNRTRNRKLLSVLLEKLPLLLMSAASCVMTLRAQHGAGAVVPLQFLTMSQRLRNAILAYAGYLTKAFWPVDLAVVYPLRNNPSPGLIAVAALLIVGITILVVVRRGKQPWLAVGWFWFLGTLIPVLGLVQVGDQLMADRYTYFPLLGVFIMIAWSLPAAWFAQARAPVMAVVVVLIIATLATITFRQVQVWENTTTLFTHAISVTEGNLLAHNALAVEAMKHGDLAAAGAHVTKALQIKPNYPAARYTLGMVLVQQGDFNKAIEQYNLALQSSQPGTMAATIWNGLGGAKAQLGRLDEAVSDYRHALELNPNQADAYTNLGSALVAQGKFAEAAEMAEKAVALGPRSADAHACLASALMNLGHTDEAILQNRKALEFNPNLVSARLNLAASLSVKGNYDEAIAHIEHVLRLHPQHEVAQKLLSAAKRNRDGAVTQP